MNYRKHILWATGLLIAVLAIFAKPLGLDNNSNWGAGRLVLLGVGIFLVLLGFLIFIFKHPFKKLEEWSASHYSIQLKFFSFCAFLMVAAFYLWTFWPFLNSEPTTDNYTQLAISFKSGYLHLNEQPPAELLALENPYDWSARYSFRKSFTMDVSLYGGRFYLYWGPVPSLLLAVFSAERLQSMGDQHVFFVFQFGLFIYCCFLMCGFWKKFNRSLPPWTIGVAILAAGITGPAARMLNLSSVYEAAIAGSQFFFIGGIYWAYAALQSSLVSSWKIAFAGLHWALAIGTRLTVLPAVVFLIALVLFYIWRKNISLRSQWKVVTAFVLLFPLLILALGLGWYNYARFGSIIEFGLRYQLAQVNYQEFTKVFSLDYVRSNFLAYFLAPLELQPNFPYIRAVETLYSNERISGLVYTTPLFLFSSLPIVQFLFSGAVFQRVRTAFQNGISAEKWLVAGLIGSAAILLVIILMYYYPAVRFMEEFLPSMMLLAGIGFGAGYSMFHNNTAFERVYLFFVAAVVFVSVAVSILSTIPLRRIDALYPFIKYIEQIIGIR